MPTICRSLLNSAGNALCVADVGGRARKDDLVIASNAARRTSRTKHLWSINRAGTPNSTILFVLLLWSWICEIWKAPFVS